MKKSQRHRQQQPCIQSALLFPEQKYLQGRAHRRQTHYAWCSAVLLSSILSSAPSSFTNDSAATSSSLSSSRITRTPCVDLPITEISFALVRIALPFFDTNISSSSSVTAFMPTTKPFLSVKLMFVTPLPPLLMSRYSVIAVRLPYPLFVTVNSVFVSSATSIPTTISLSCNRMPRTPLAFLPMDLTSFSSKRTAMP